MCCLSASLEGAFILIPPSELPPHLVGLPRVSVPPPRKPAAASVGRTQQLKPPFCIFNNLEFLSSPGSTDLSLLLLVCDHPRRRCSSICIFDGCHGGEGWLCACWIPCAETPYLTTGVLLELWIRHPGKQGLYSIISRPLSVFNRQRSMQLFR